MKSQKTRIRAQLRGEGAPKGPARPPRTGIVLVDPHHVVRAGLTLLFSTQEDMEIVEEASGAEQVLEVLATLRRHTPVTVMVSLDLDGERDAYWLMRAIRERFPTLRILACGRAADSAVVSRALFAGADGFVNKSSTPEEFIDAVRRAIQGEVVLQGLSPESLVPVMAGIERQRDTEPLLTPRERQILEVASEGLTARQIGTRLGLRERTVTTHLSRIYRKLGVGSRVQAIAAAAQGRVASLGEGW
jgi:DNA-binding NarL/FixJ family response regulator